MTNRAKAFLGSYMEARERMESKMEEYEKSFSTAYSLTQQMSEEGGGSTVGFDKMEKAVLLMMSLSDLIFTDCIQTVQAQIDVGNFIDRLGTQDKKHRQYRTVLRMRYMSGMEWDAIAEKLGGDSKEYTSRHVQRLHGEALELANEAMAEESN